MVQGSHHCEIHVPSRQQLNNIWDKFKTINKAEKKESWVTSHLQR